MVAFPKAKEAPMKKGILQDPGRSVRMPKNASHVPGWRALPFLQRLEPSDRCRRNGGGQPVGVQSDLSVNCARLACLARTGRRFTQSAYEAVFQLIRMVDELTLAAPTLHGRHQTAVDEAHQPPGAG